MSFVNNECYLSAAALKMCDGDEENSILSLTPSQDGAPAESLTDPLRVDWPKDRVLINRIDNICSLVLTGHWPSGRRYISDVQLSAAVSEEHDLGGDLGYPRVVRKGNSALSAEAVEGQDTEFTVKLLKVLRNPGWIIFVHIWKLETNVLYLCLWM